MATSRKTAIAWGIVAHRARSEERSVLVYENANKSRTWARVWDGDGHADKMKSAYFHRNKKIKSAPTQEAAEAEAARIEAPPGREPMPEEYRCQAKAYMIPPYQQEWISKRASEEGLSDSAYLRAIIQDDMSELVEGE